MAAGEPAARSEPADGLVQRYEALRHQVLGGQAPGFRLGLAVLQRQGMTAWLRAWGDLGGVAASPAAPPADVPAAAVPESVVAVLASMTLAAAGTRGTP